MKEELIAFQKELRFTNERMAKLLGVSTRSVNGWRSDKEIPPWIVSQLKVFIWLRKERVVNPFVDV